jgi:hypothetical protein
MREHLAFEEGRTTAAAEVAAGRLGYRLFGKPNWQACAEAAATLKERFGIVLQVDGFCITPLEVAAEAGGYNERMQQEIQSRFGHDVVSAVFREVERKHKKARKKFRFR